MSKRWSELPSGTRKEVDAFVDVLVEHRDDDAATCVILRAAREALPGRMAMEASWWRRMLLRAAEVRLSNE